MRKVSENSRKAWTVICRSSGVVAHEHLRQRLGQQIGRHGQNRARRRRQRRALFQHALQLRVVFRAEMEADDGRAAHGVADVDGDEDETERTSARRRPPRRFRRRSAAAGNCTACSPASAEMLLISSDEPLEQACPSGPPFDPRPAPAEAGCRSAGRSRSAGTRRPRTGSDAVASAAPSTPQPKHGDEQRSPAPCWSRPRATVTYRPSLGFSAVMRKALKHVLQHEGRVRASTTMRAVPHGSRPASRSVGAQQPGRWARRSATPRIGQHHDRDPSVSIDEHGEIAVGRSSVRPRPGSWPPARCRRCRS